MTYVHILNCLTRLCSTFANAIPGATLDPGFFDFYWGPQAASPATRVTAKMVLDCLVDLLLSVD